MSASDARHFPRPARALAPADRADASGAPRWERPAFEVICLACEISAYAPDEGDPLF